MNSAQKYNTPSIRLSFQYETTDIYITEKLLKKWIKESIKISFPHCPYAMCNKLSLNIRVVDEKEIQELNKIFRKKDSATNVITFEYGIDHGYLTGDVIICLPIVEMEAIQQKKTFLDHAAHIIIHGVLHAIGFDHLNDDDAIEMETMEIEILKDLNIKNPYL